MNNTNRAIIRSIMPLLTTLVASAIAHFGYHVANSTVVQIVAYGTSGLTIALHALEVRWPWFGVLLGYKGAPVFPPSAKTNLEQQLANANAQLVSVKYPSIVLTPGVPKP